MFYNKRKSKPVFPNVGPTPHRGQFDYYGAQLGNGRDTSLTLSLRAILIQC